MWKVTEESEKEKIGKKITFNIPFFPILQIKIYYESTANY